MAAEAAGEDAPIARAPTIFIRFAAAEEVELAAALVDGAADQFANQQRARIARRQRGVEPVDVDTRCSARAESIAHAGGDSSDLESNQAQHPAAIRLARHGVVKALHCRGPE